MAYNPKASSTPKTIRGRPPIRSQQSIQSPIGMSQFEESHLKSNDNNTDEHTSDDHKSDDHKSDQEREDNYEAPLSNELSPSKYWYLCYVLIVAIPFIALYLYNPEEQATDGATSQLEILQKQFPQDEDFWISVKVIIDDITVFKQPKSIIFLYKNKNTLTDIVNSISKYASSKLCHSSEPIVVPVDYLKKQEVLDDYGTFITYLRPKLNKKCVVIINNLDQVPATSAQAFHSLCDEYNPVERNVLYIFTLKVDSVFENSYKFVEKRLREVWSELPTDKFYPLFTRISTLILQVV